MTIIDFVNEYNYMCNGQTETLSQEELDELHVLVSGMMLDNCGSIHEFELDNKGQIFLTKTITLRKEELDFIINSLKNDWHPEKDVVEGLDPTFYRTLTFDGDKKLLEKIRSIIRRLENV